jgi:hypothetical protein
MTIVGEDDPICCFIWPFVILRRRPDEAKIHKEFGAAERDTLGGPFCGLFLDVSLLFEVNGAERVVLKNRWGAEYMQWEKVELALPGRAEP